MVDKGDYMVRMKFIHEALQEHVRRVEEYLAVKEKVDACPCRKRERKESKKFYG